MLLTNVPDFMIGEDGLTSPTLGFHIPKHPLYRELCLPYFFREEDGAMIDSKKQFAVLTVDMIHSLDWEIIDGHSKVP